MGLPRDGAGGDGSPRPRGGLGFRRRCRRRPAPGAAPQTRRSSHDTAEDRSHLLPDRRRGGRRSGREARLRGGLRPGRRAPRRDDRRRRRSRLGLLRARRRLDRRPRPRRRAASLRLERLQQRAQARGPRHGRPRAPLPAGARSALLEHLRARHRPGPAQARAGQDDRRQDAVREGRLLAPAHPALRPRRGLPHLPRRRRRATTTDRAGSRCSTTRPSTSCARGRPTAGRSTSTTTPGGTSTRTC